MKDRISLMFPSDGMAKLFLCDNWAYTVPKYKKMVLS